MKAFPRYLIIFATLPLIVSAFPTPLRNGMAYTTARQLLLKDRWVPLNLHAHDGYEFIGVERELAQRNFKEVDSCSIDYSNCVMRFKRATQCLTVYAAGERVKDMKVVDWNGECPAVEKQRRPGTSIGK